MVNHKGKDVNSDWLADQWEERSILEHVQYRKGRMKGDDPEIDTAQTPKRLDGRLALVEKIRKTFTQSIPNKQCPFGPFVENEADSRISSLPFTFTLARKEVWKERPNLANLRRRTKA